MNKLLVCADVCDLHPVYTRAGFHRRHFIQNPKEDAHGGAQTLPDSPYPTLLHEEGEVHPAELPRPPHADPHRLPQARRKWRTSGKSLLKNSRRV